MLISSLCYGSEREKKRQAYLDNKEKKKQAYKQRGQVQSISKPLALNPCTDFK